MNSSETIKIGRRLTTFSMQDLALFIPKKARAGLIMHPHCYFNKYFPRFSFVTVCMNSYRQVSDLWILRHGYPVKGVNSGRYIPTLHSSLIN